MDFKSRAVVFLAAIALMASCTREDAVIDDPAEPERVQVDETPTETPEEPTETLTRRHQEPTPLPGTPQALAPKYKSWGVVHSFLSGTVVNGFVVSAREAIAFTKDNHVGVTTDSGNSWSFVRHVTGSVMAVSGTPGGPYVVAGKRGYLAISTDGKMWRDLPKHNEQDMISIAVGPQKICAVGKKGAVVSYDKNGGNGVFRMMPDNFKAKVVIFHGGKFIAFSGKKGYESVNGFAWTALPQLPFLPTGKKIATSKGECGIGKVGKTKGVVCEVAGTGHGLTSTTTVVEQKNTVAFTKDSGNNWLVSVLPFKGLNAVIGAGGGPYYALGKKGGLAVTRDGATWKAKPVNATKNLNAGLIDGANIVIVGDGGTIIRSTNGGESFAVVPPPSGGAFKQIVKQGAKLIIPVKKSGIESADGGATWTEIADPSVLEAIPIQGKPGKCDNRLPAPGEICKFSRKVTTPLGLPKVKSFAFNGDIGLAMGDAGLVAFSTDGGATWQAKSGFVIKRGLVDFETTASVAVGVGNNQVFVSTDSGKSFREGQLPKGIGSLWEPLIASDKAVYIVGDKGTILKATGALLNWVQLPTYPKNKVKYRGIFEINGALYATGLKGELDRSDNKGATWRIVATGVTTPIMEMTGEGSTVLAAVKAPKKGGNLLMRSDDNGLHFYIQREISDDQWVHEFRLQGSTLYYDYRTSTDFGATWTLRPDHVKWAVDVGDGSGVRIRNYRKYKSKSQFTLISKDGKERVIVDSFFNNDAVFRCDGTTGCWMFAGGQVYRPI